MFVTPSWRTGKFGGDKETGPAVPKARMLDLNASRANGEQSP